MDFNRLSYYRANPFVNNDYIPNHSMANRSPKSCISQIPQGQQHLPLRSGKRIYKQKVYQDQIDKQKILQSPQKYPFENRIAFNKNYSRNLDTIDIQGASSGTLISESLRNKNKALQQLKRKNQNLISQTNPLLIKKKTQNLDNLYEQKRRQLAQKISDQKQSKISIIKQQKLNNNHNNHNNNNNNNQRTKYQSIDNSNINMINSQQNPHSLSKLPQVQQRQFLQQYQRYISLNSNQKYNPNIANSGEFQKYHSNIANSNQFQGFQRYKKNPPQFMNNQTKKLTTGTDQHLRSQNYHSTIQKQQANINDYQNNINSNIIKRSQSIEQKDQRFKQDNSSIANYAHGNHNQYLNSHIININNRHRSNPEYIDNYPSELNKRIEQKHKNQVIQDNIKNVYQIDRKQFRKHNPTNLSFNIAARSSLMSPII